MGIKKATTTPAKSAEKRYIVAVKNSDQVISEESVSWEKVVEEAQEYITDGGYTPDSIGVYELVLVGTPKIIID